MLTLISTLTCSLTLGALSVLAAPLPDDASQAARQLPSYPLDVCVVSGEALGGEDMGDPIEVIHEGQLVMLCCKGCAKEFRANPDVFIDKIKTAVIASQAPGYPMTTCPVSGDELVEGEFVDVVYNTRLIRLCGPECARKFGSGNAKVLAAVDEAYMAAQRENYPLTTCLVAGEELGDGVVEELYGTQLVRFCCKKCLRDFGTNPRKYLAQLEAAPAKRTGPETTGRRRAQGKDEGDDGTRDGGRGGR